MLGFGDSKQETVAETLYGQAIDIARTPKLYTDYGVTDDVDGRFDALCLVVMLMIKIMAMKLFIQVKVDETLAQVFRFLIKL